MIKISTRDPTADMSELDLIQEFLIENTAREQAMQPLNLPGPPPPPQEREDTHPVILVSRGTAPQVPLPQSQLSVHSSSLAMPLPSLGGQKGQSRRGRGAQGGIPAVAGRASPPDRSDTEFLDRFLEKPQLEIAEQPKERGMRFRYECEGRSAGSILGASSTESNKTVPSIEIKGCTPNIKGIKVTVSLVTKDIPHRPHPHSLVGKDCADGICVVRLNHNKSCRHSFSNLGIQCVRRKELEKALEKRRSQKIDPFNTGHSKSIEDIDMNVVRLCFQCEVETESKERILLAPVVSSAIYDKKATTTSELKINRLNVVRGPCTGKTEIYLLCDKVQKDDIEIIFSLEKWEAKAEFAQTDVHRQIAIVFKSPPYQEQNIREDVDVNVFLRRLSDHMDSEPVKFTYEPQNPDPYEVNRKRKLKSDIKPNERCTVAAQSELLPESLSPLSFPPLPYVHPDGLQSELVAPQMMEEIHYPSNALDVKQEEDYCPSLEMLDSGDLQALLGIFESPAAAGFPQLGPGLHEHEQVAPQAYGLSSGVLPQDSNSNYALPGLEFYSRLQHDINFYNDVRINNYGGQQANGRQALPGPMQALLEGLDSPAPQPQHPCDNQDPALGPPIKTESHINL